MTWTWSDDGQSHDERVRAEIWESSPEIHHTINPHRDGHISEQATLQI